VSQQNLPRATPKFSGEIKKVITDSKPEKLVAPKAPTDAPNILLIMLDDVGFGSFGNFGGPVTTPGLDKIAKQGLRYNQFHTTALCSPTRAALLTGRNHHAVHMGGITEIANSFPGYDSAIPPESATVAQVLRMSGYSTACFGKWHLTPSWEQSPAGPFDRWPTGLGFDRFRQHQSHRMSATPIITSLKISLIKQSLGCNDKKPRHQTNLSSVIFQPQPYMHHIMCHASGLTNTKANLIAVGTHFAKRSTSAS
jgi:hypothetical protein